MSRLPWRILLAILVLLRTPLLFAQDTPDPKQKIESLEQEAQKYLHEQKPELAIPIFRQIISLDPANVSAHGDLGVLLFFQNKYPEAIPELRATLNLDPKLWKIESLLGIAEKRTGDLTAAKSNLEQSFPNLEDAKIQKQTGLELIEIILASGELDQAATIIAKLEGLAPEDPQVLFAAYQISLQMVDRSLLNMALAAPKSAELHMMIADQFVLQGDTENAIAQYREAIRLNPRLPGVHFELAVQLKGSSNPVLKAQAEGEFRSALNLNQFDEKAWRGLGEVMADKGNSQAAKEDFTKALSLFPKDSDAETDLAKLFISNNDSKSAMTLLESAVRDDPTNTVAHYQLSALYRRAGRAADSQHEMDEFAHYKAVRDELAKVFREFRQQDDTASPSNKPATH